MDREKTAEEQLKAARDLAATTTRVVEISTTET
jgi:hypothetical protein